MSDNLDNKIIGKKAIDPMAFEDNSPYAEKKKKPIQPMVFDVPTKSFEDKIYIVLLYDDNNDNLFDGQYKVCIGRTECYRYIQTLIEAFGTYIDVHESKVITETKQTESDTGNSKYYMINIMESLSVYAFCKSVESYYSKNDFSIDNYFEPPKEYKENIVDLEKDAFSYSASIDDQIIAQAAAETFRERSKAVSQFPHYVEKELKKEFDHSYISEFPDLFKNNDDGSVNV